MTKLLSSKRSAALRKLLYLALIIPTGKVGFSSKAHGASGTRLEGSPVETWLVLSKRAQKLLQPLPAPPKSQALASDSPWQSSFGYRVGLYNSLAGYAKHLAQSEYDARQFRVLTDSMMADDLAIKPTELKGFIEAFFKVAAKAPSHNQRLQNLVIWFNHSAFAPYRDAIQLRMYRLYRDRKRLDLFPSKARSLLSRHRVPAAMPADSFERRSALIREQMVKDVLATQQSYAAKRQVCRSLAGSSSARACLTLGWLEALKADNPSWTTRFARMAAESPSGAITGRLTAELIHWLTYRERFAEALSQFDRLHKTWQHRPLPLDVKQLELFLTVRTGAYERFDRKAAQLEARLDSAAQTWRSSLAALTSFKELHSSQLVAKGLAKFSFEPLAPWLQRLEQYHSTKTELQRFGHNLLKFSQWQRLNQPYHQFEEQYLKQDTDMAVVSGLIDDFGQQLVKGSIAELKGYQDRISVADKITVLTASKLILDQDSRFSRYSLAAKLIEPHSPQQPWQELWRQYIKTASTIGLNSALATGLNTQHSFLAPLVYKDIMISHNVLAQHRRFERRALMWQHIIARQQAVAHHATRIQLALEKYRDTIAPALVSSYEAQGQFWQRIGGLMSTIYQRTKDRVSKEKTAFDRQQNYVLSQSQSLEGWHKAIKAEENQLWQAFARAKPELLHSFDIMILRQRQLLQKWRTDRMSGQYLSAVDHSATEQAAKDKLETLASSLKTLKMSAWLDWQTITTR